MTVPTPSVRPQELSDHSTLPGRLVQAAQRHPARIALRQKDLGIYVEYSWADYRAAVATAALALRRRGIGQGDVVAILSDNCVEWVVADFAVQALGGIACGIYPSNVAAEVEYILRHSGARMVVVEDQEQVDKVLAVRDRLPDLAHVVIVDPRGTRGYPDGIESWSELMQEGDELPVEAEDRLDDLVRDLSAEEPAVLIYTSGTTADPKGALLSHRNLTALADRMVRSTGLTVDDTMLSYLPLCHAAEKILTELMPVTTGSLVHFGESLSTVQQDLVEISPTVFIGMPRIWEKMQAAVDVGIRRSGPVKRVAYQACLKLGYRLLDRETQGEHRVRNGLQRRAIDLLVFRALRERLGLQRSWFVLSGGAPIGPELLRWLHAIGVPVTEAYGQTESGVTHLIPPGSPPRIGTVGPAMDDVECRLAADGEIELRSPTNFLGYLHDDDATRRALTPDDWILTGDLGEEDGDHLRVIGRKKQIIITAGGKNLSPASIENALKASPYVSHVVPVGDRRPYVTALIQIDWDTVGDWAAQHGVPYTSFADLTTKEEVIGLIEQEVDRANEHLARVSQVRRFRLLDKQLHQDDGELTPTQKVKREFVLDKFADLVEGLYEPSRTP